MKKIILSIFFVLVGFLATMGIPSGGSIAGHRFAAPYDSTQGISESTALCNYFNRINSYWIYWNKSLVKFKKRSRKRN